MNVSIVSVSRRAGSPQVGQGTFTQSSSWARGEAPLPLKARLRGSSTGNWSTGTGTTPQLSQWITGIGQPQYRWREMSQSRSRNWTRSLPQPSCSAKATMTCFACAEGMPSKRPECTSTPGSVQAPSAPAGPFAPSGTITGRTGSSYCRANTKSRWSWAGTPITAPVPYSART